MIISKNSWHYKLLTDKMFGFFNPVFYDMDISRSLCIYFWQVILVIALRILLAIIVISPLHVLLAFGLDGHVVTGSGILDIFFFINFLTGLIVSGLLGLSIVLGSLKLIYWKIEEYLPEKKKQEKKPKQPNILVEYIKAKKEKVCPMIEFKE